MLQIAAIAFLFGIAIIVGGLYTSWRCAQVSERVILSVASMIVGSGPIISGLGLMLKQHSQVQIGNAVGLCGLAFLIIATSLRLLGEQRRSKHR